MSLTSRVDNEMAAQDNTMIDDGNTKGIKKMG